MSRYSISQSKQDALQAGRSLTRVPPSLIPTVAAITLVGCLAGCASLNTAPPVPSAPVPSPAEKIAETVKNLETAPPKIDGISLGTSSPDPTPQKIFARAASPSQENPDSPKKGQPDPPTPKKEGVTPPEKIQHSPQEKAVAAVDLATCAVELGASYFTGIKPAFLLGKLGLAVVRAIGGGIQDGFSGAMKEIGEVATNGASSVLTEGLVPNEEKGPRSFLFSVFRTLKNAWGGQKSPADQTVPPPPRPSAQRQARPNGPSLCVGDCGK